MNKNLSKLLGAFLIIFLNGLLFSIMHWKNNIPMVTVGGIGTAILTLVRFGTKEIKLNSDYIKYPAFALFVIGRILFVNHINFGNLIGTVAAALLFIWVMWYMFENKFKMPKFNSIFGSISIVLLIIASLFKVMHWVGGDILILVSYTLLVVWVGYRYVVKPRES